MMRRAQPALGTLVDITLAEPGPDAQAAFTRAFGQIALVQRLMSFHDPESDLSRINHARPGDVIAVDAHTAEVLRQAEALRHASDGIFNIACADPLMAWGYLPPLAAGEPVPAAAVSATSSSPPYISPLPVSLANPSPLPASCQVLDSQHVQKLGHARLDLGGIAKGYAVDLAVAALQAHGVPAACVNAGGDLRAYGEVSFPVWIRHPGQPTHLAWQTMLKHQALASSARYFAANQYGHLLDGRTGQPVQADYAVCTSAPTCLLADALCKIVFASANPHHPCLARFAANAHLIAP